MLLSIDCFAGFLHKQSGTVYSHYKVIKTYEEISQVLFRNVPFFEAQMLSQKRNMKIESVKFRYQHLSQHSSNQLSVNYQFRKGLYCKCNVSPCYFFKSII